MSRLLKNINIYSKKGIAQYDYGNNTSVSGLTLTDESEAPVFQNESYNNSSYIVKQSTTQILLKAGKKYKLLGSFGIIATTSGYAYLQWYDVTHSSYIGSFMFCPSVTETNFYSSGGFCSAIIEVTEDTIVSFRTKIVSGDPITQIYAPSVVIEELETYTEESIGSLTTNEINVANNGKIYQNGTDINEFTGVYRNAIINGDMAISQRGTSFTTVTDLEYTLDRSQVLSDGDNIVDIDQVDEGSSQYSMKFTVATANKKFAYCQPIEGINAQKFQNQIVSISFEAKTTTAKEIENLRCALLSFTGTIDTQGDPVSVWNAEGADPTWSANYTAENTPSDLALTTTYQTFKIENISIDTASMNNLVLVIWCDDTDAAIGDEVFIKNIQINLGSRVLPFEHLSYEENLRRCQRYYEIGISTWCGDATTGNGYLTRSIFTILKRGTPTVSATLLASSRFPSSDPTPSAESLTGFRGNLTANATGARGYFSYSWTADSEL